jgi:hypothetical protein
MLSKHRKVVVKREGVHLSLNNPSRFSPVERDSSSRKQQIATTTRRKERRTTSKDPTGYTTPGESRGNTEELMVRRQMFRQLSRGATRESPADRPTVAGEKYKIAFRDCILHVLHLIRAAG